MSNYSYLYIETKDIQNMVVTIDGSLEHHFAQNLYTATLVSNSIKTYSISSITNSNAYLAIDTWSNCLSYITNLWLE